MYNDDVWVVMKFVLVVAAVFAVVFWSLNGLSDYQCSSRWRMAGKDASYSFSTGCMVRVDGKWVPETTLRNFQQD